MNVNAYQSMVRHGELRVPAANVSLLFIAIFVYIKLHLSIKGLGVPYFFAHATAIFYFSKVGIKARYFIYLMLGGLFLFVQYIFTARDWLSPSKSDVQYAIYWLLNLITIFGFLRILQDCKREYVHKFSRVFMYMMILVGIAEVYLGAKPLLDAIRDLYTSGSAAYIFVDRDIAQYGAIRPNVFTSEPSSVGNYFGFLWMLFLITSRRRKRPLIEAGVLLLVAIYVFRTPTLIGYSVAMGALWMATNQKKLVSTIGILSVLGLFLFSALGPYILFVNAGKIQNETLSAFIGTGSYYIRQMAPINTFLSMLSENPIVGYGYQYVDMARRENFDILLSDYGGFYTLDKLSDMQAGQFSSNAFWEFISTNGCVGGLVLLAIYRRIFRDFGVTRLAILLLVSASLLMMHAGLILPFTWTPVIVIAYYLSRPEFWPSARSPDAQRADATTPMLGRRIYQR